MHLVTHNQDLIARGRKNVQWARTHMPALIAAAAAVLQETFADKIKRAIAARLPRAQTRKQHAEQAEKERSRYLRKRRARTKGE
jgi:hypothetical protein